MTTPNEIYERTMKMLKPAFDRVATDPDYRARLEADPLAALAEVNAEIDDETRQQLEGRRFSEFWALRRQAAEGPVEVRDLPPEEGLLTGAQLEKVAGGFKTLKFRPMTPTLSPSRTSSLQDPLTSFAPPYTPVAPDGGDFG